RRARTASSASHTRKAPPTTFTTRRNGSPGAVEESPAASRTSIAPNVRFAPAIARSPRPTPPRDASDRSSSWTGPGEVPSATPSPNAATGCDRSRVTARRHRGPASARGRSAGGFAYHAPADEGRRSGPRAGRSHRDPRRVHRPRWLGRRRPLRFRSEPQRLADLRRPAGDLALRLHERRLDRDHGAEGRPGDAEDPEPDGPRVARAGLLLAGSDRRPPRAGGRRRRGSGPERGHRELPGLVRRSARSGHRAGDPGHGPRQLRSVRAPLGLSAHGLGAA